MDVRKQAKLKLAELTKKQTELLREIREAYCLEENKLYSEDYSLKDGIFGGELFVEWYEFRDIDYTDDLISCYERLIHALELNSQNDEKLRRDAVKLFESLEQDAYRIKRGKLCDVKKAEEAITAMNKIISVCNEFRTKQ